MDLTRVYNTDCLPAMKDLPDDYFDLAIVDPEYREENQPTQQMRAKGNMKNWNGKSDINYFLELFRVSKEQIIWGGNYYTEFLPPNNNWIVWYKNNDGTGFSMAELAWSSITKNVKVLELRSPQTLQNEARIHPTQKPVKLYKWLLKNYRNICLSDKPERFCYSIKTISKPRKRGLRNTRHSLNYLKSNTF